MKKLEEVKLSMGNEQTIRYFSLQNKGSPSIVLSKHIYILKIKKR